MQPATGPLAGPDPQTPGPAVSRSRRKGGAGWARLVGGLLVATFALTSTRMIAVSFHPLPISDAWGGAIGYWLSPRQVGWSALWGFHNEHRMPWSRLLFWVDTRVLDGGQVFLLTVDLLIVAAIACTIGLLARAVLRESDTATSSTRVALTAGALSAGMLSAAQVENLVLPFQSTQLLAVLFPLLACIAAGASAGAAPPRRGRRSAIATILGLAAVGSAASCLATPFVVAFVLWAGGARRRRVAVDVVLGSAVALGYRVGAPGSSNGGPSASLSSPLRFVRYLLELFGSSVGVASFEQVPSIVFGAAFVIGTIGVCVRALRRPVRRPWELAAVGHLATVVSTGAVIALGRSPFGVQQALASRYQTVVLSGVVVLLLLLVADPPPVPFARPASLALVLALPLGLLPLQVYSLHHGWAVELPGMQRVNAVGPALDARDDQALAALLAAPPSVRDIARRAVAQGVTVLAAEPYRSLTGRIGRVVTVGHERACSARFTLGPALDRSDYRRVRAAVDRRGGRAERDGIAAVVDREGRTVGFVVVGVRSPLMRRVFEATDAAPPGSDLAVGYARTDATGPLRLVLGTSACRVVAG